MEQVKYQEPKYTRYFYFMNDILSPSQKQQGNSNVDCIPRAVKPKSANA